MSTEDFTTPASPASTDVSGMFNRIAHRYDLLNRSLSMGQDVVWRKRVARHLPDRTDLRLLDLATGTGDQLIYLSYDPRITSGLGLDLAEKMLDIGREKLVKRKLGAAYELKTGDAINIPVEDNAFDVATITFGIRNVLDVEQGLREMFRVLKPGGRAIILEFSLPRNRLMRSLYLFYFRRILPRIGGMVSGDSYAYRYLNQTVETFPYGDAFCELMRKAGFEEVRATPLTFGIASIYQGDKR